MRAIYNNILYYIMICAYIQGDFCKSKPPDAGHSVFYFVVYETRNFCVLEAEIKFVFTKFVVM